VLSKPEIRLAPAPAPAAATAPAARPRATEWFPMRALTHVLFLAFVVIAVIYAAVVVWLGGRSYYGTPLRVRGYAPEHGLLRPSGEAGILFGIVGLALIGVTLIYAIRKKLRPKGGGSQKIWLEVHIFCGLVGPALITLHTSFKFNGLVSVAYWSMVVVVLSGFVGRYLYVRIPKTLRGVELSAADLEARVAEIRELLGSAGLSPEELARIDGRDPSGREPARPGLVAGLLFGDLLGWIRSHRLKRHLHAAGAAPELVHETVGLISERDALQRRIALLGRTKMLFDLWHVLHKPLVYVMLVIAALHVFVVVYFGYAPGRGR
jgi:hypothetical protein